MRIRNQKRAGLLLCSAAFAVLTVPALAKPVHKAAQRPPVAAQAQTIGTADSQPYPMATVAPATGKVRAARGRAVQKHPGEAFGGFSSNSLVTEARKYIGTNPTGRGSLWCGAFMDLVLKRTGHAGGGNLASAYAKYGRRVSGPQVGAIAVMGRNGGGHVGVVTGVDPNGNPIIVSGNTWSRESGGRRAVLEHAYPRGRIIAYVVPGG